MKKAIAILTIITVLLLATACNTSYILVASEIAKEAAVIVQPESAEAAAYLSMAGDDLAQLGIIVNDIKAAKDATAKQALLVRAQSIISAATGHLTQTLAVLHISNPNTVHQVQVAVGIVNGALAILVKNLPGAAPHSLIHAKLPMSSGKDAKDFRREWEAAKESE